MSKKKKNTEQINQKETPISTQTTDAKENFSENNISPAKEIKENMRTEDAKDKITKSEAAEPEKNEFTGEDNLELHKMKASERRKAKIERFKKNTEGMSKKEKLSYFIYYYKWPVIWTALFIIIGTYFITSIYKNTRPIALGYAVINSADPDHINKDVIDEYMDFYGLDNGYQLMEDNEVRMNYEEYQELVTQGTMDNNTDYTQFPLLCWNGYYDIIFTDKAGLEYCSKESVIEPLENAFTNDLQDIIYENYNELLIESPNYDNQPVAYAIDVSNCKKIKELNLNLKEVYICFPASTPQNDDRDRNMANRKRFLNFIFNLNIEI